MAESRSHEASGPTAEPGTLAQAVAPGPAAPLSSMAGAMGNVAFSRSILARQTPAPAAPDAAAASGDPADYALKLGDQLVRDKLVPKKPVSKEIKSKFQASTPKALGRLELNIVPGFFAHFGVTASVAAAAGARVSLSMDRDGDTDKVNVNGAANAKALLIGSMSAGLGIGFKGLNVTAHASGSLRLDAAGSATIKGDVKRTGKTGSWGGRVDIDGELRGSLTAAASGYFSWQVLWWDGTFGEFKIAEWKLGEASIKVKGWADLNGGSEIKLTPDFSPPAKPKVITKGKTSPPAKEKPGGAKVAPKRFDVPREGPRDVSSTGSPRSGLRAFEALVARQEEGATGTAPEPAEPAGAPPADPNAPVPGGAAPPEGEAAPPAGPPASPAEAGLPGEAEGFVSVPTEPTEGA